MEPSDVLREVQERDVRFVRLWFTDILGHLKSFSLPVGDLEAAFTQGVRFDGSSITGFNPVEESDMVAVPDPDTFAVLPYRPQEQAVARLFCDIRTLAGAPYEGDPRYVRNMAVMASHVGFPFNPLVFAVIGNHLVEPQQRWSLCNSDYIRPFVRQVSG